MRVSTQEQYLISILDLSQITSFYRSGSFSNKRVEATMVDFSHRNWLEFLFLARLQKLNFMILLDDLLKLQIRPLKWSALNR